MNDKIRSLLRDLYGAEHVDTIAQSLQELIDTVRHYIPDSPLVTSFSEQDIALITYGDSLVDDQREPLAVLQQFLKEHLTNLISIVHILPFHPFSSDDGFSVIDYETVNAKLGNWTHIHRIADNFVLMSDFVLNHMSAQSIWFRSFLAGNSDFSQLYLTMPKDTDVRGVTRPRTSDLLTPFQMATGEEIHVWTTFSADQVDFDYRAPATMLRMIKLLLNYVEHGAKVLRLDAVAYLWKEVGTSCIHLPQTHTFIQLMRTILDEVAPYVWLITETNVPHQENISYFGNGTNEAQLVYNFTLPPLLLLTMNTQNTSLLHDWVNTLKPISEQTTFFNFTASHDGIGVRPLEGIVSPGEVQSLADKMIVKGGRVSYREQPDGSQTPYEINITYVDAIIDADLSTDLQVKQFMVSQSVMLSLAGVPAVYIHSLLGSHNDEAAVEKLGYPRAINRAPLDHHAIQQAIHSVDSFRKQIFTTYQKLLRVRRQTPYFNPSVSQHSLDVNNPAIFALLRQINDEKQLLAVHNLSTQPQSITIDSYFKVTSGYDILTNQTVSLGKLELAPFAVLWLDLAER